MKLTIGDLYKELGKQIYNNPDGFEDLIITDVECSSTVGVQTGVKPEDRLQKLRITAVSKDDNLIVFIDL